MAMFIPLNTEPTKCIFVDFFYVEILLKIRIQRRFATLLRDAFVLFSINLMFRHHNSGRNCDVNFALCCLFFSFALLSPNQDDVVAMCCLKRTTNFHL